jgi:hypothetical protein
MINALTQVAQLLPMINLPMINQEGGAMPGESLTAIETFTYFVAAPIGLFVLIGGLSWIASAPKKSQKKETTNQRNDDNDFITYIS